MRRNQGPSFTQVVVIEHLLAEVTIDLRSYSTTEATLHMLLVVADFEKALAKATKHDYFKAAAASSKDSHVVVGSSSARHEEATIGKLMVTPFSVAKSSKAAAIMEDTKASSHWVPMHDH